jgi:hypothetical protein
MFVIYGPFWMPVQWKTGMKGCQAALSAVHTACSTQLRVQAPFYQRLQPALHYTCPAPFLQEAKEFLDHLHSGKADESPPIQAAAPSPAAAQAATPPASAAKPGGEQRPSSAAGPRRRTQSQSRTPPAAGAAARATRGDAAQPAKLVATGAAGQTAALPVSAQKPPSSSTVTRLRTHSPLAAAAAAGMPGPTALWHARTHSPVAAAAGMPAVHPGSTGTTLGWRQSPQPQRVAGKAAAVCGATPKLPTAAAAAAQPSAAPGAAKPKPAASSGPKPAVAPQVGRNIRGMVCPSVHCGMVSPPIMLTFKGCRGAGGCQGYAALQALCHLEAGPSALGHYPTAHHIMLLSVHWSRSCHAPAAALQADLSQPPKARAAAVAAAAAIKASSLVGKAVPASATTQPAPTQSASLKAPQQLPAVQPAPKASDAAAKVRRACLQLRVTKEGVPSTQGLA